MATAPRQASIMQSMFGMAPEQVAGQLAQQQQDQALARNVELSKLSPFQQVGAFGGAAGEMTGMYGSRLVGSMLGLDIEDPRIKRARVIQETLNNLPMGAAADPAMYGPELVRGLQAAGLGQDAVLLSDELQDRFLNQAKTAAEIQAKRYEASGIGKYTPDKYTTDSWAKFTVSRDPRVLVLNPGSKSAQIQARDDMNDMIKRMQQNNQTLEDLNPYDQMQLYTNAVAALGAEGASRIFPEFTKNGALTESEAKTVRFATMMAQAKPVVDQMEDRGMRVASNIEQLLSIPTLSGENPVLTTLKMAGVPDDQLRLMDAYLNYLGPALYQKTGAAVTISEFLRDARGYILWRHDDEESSKNKRQARNAQFVGTEESLSGPGRTAYFEGLKRLGLPEPKLGERKGPLSRQTPSSGAPQQSATPKAAGSTLTPPDPSQFNTWWNSLTDEQKRQVIQQRQQRGQ